jgi:hypothetical protein
VIAIFKALISIIQYMMKWRDYFMNLTSDVELFLTEVSIPIRVACLTPSDWPIVVSLWYLFEDGKIFCATKQTAKIVTYLSRNQQCGFEVAGDFPPYCGVRGRGTASIDPIRGLEILNKLLVRYSIGQDTPLARKLLSNAQSEVAIVIQPESIHTWNFTERMKQSIPQFSANKACPK